MCQVSVQECKTVLFSGLNCRFCMFVKRLVGVRVWLRSRVEGAGVVGFLYRGDRESKTAGGFSVLRVW